MIAEFQYFLEVVSASSKGKKIVIRERRTVIGRQQLHFDPAVSREHFMVKNGGEYFHIRDMGSANRTVLNGAPIEKGRDVEIKIGDVVRVGQTRLKLLAEEILPQHKSEVLKEMPYENKGKEVDGKVSEPDKRGMDLNIGTMGTTFGKAVDKFRKLSKFSTDIGVTKIREVKKVDIDVTQVGPAAKDRPAKWKSILIWVGIVALSAGAAAFFLD